MAALLQAVRYGAANARVHALLAQMISPRQWAELLDAPDLLGVVMVLRDTWAGPALPTLGDTEPNAIHVERALARQMVAAARLPLSLLQGTPRDLLDWYWRRFEVDNLKRLLRGVHHETPPSQIQTALVVLGPASTLPWSDLANAASLPALVERLTGTWYGRVLRPALDQVRRQHSVFPLEVALDLAYGAELIERIARLHGADHADAVTFLGAWVDAQNLLWAYRYHLYAYLSPEEILNYTLQRGLRVNAGVVRTIALGAPLLNVVQDVWHGKLAGLDALAGMPEPQALPRLELLFQRVMYAQAQRARGTAVLRLATILAYVFLLDYELRDLVAVVEGKSFGWRGDQIQPYLIGKRGV